ncbi:hypothetical protein E2320_002368 [Naja naja]|nr:hypothetical protein E2320_002368 [Naja naja]
MEYVQSFTWAIDIIHNELDAEELGRPLFSVRRSMDELNADQFLSYVESLLQSNAELIWRNSLELTVTVMKNHEGAALGN